MLPGTTSGSPRIAWSCVVDDTPQIWSSILPWLATATDVAGIAPNRLFVHHACALRPDIETICRKLGVNTIAVDPFDPRSPHCNKIRQCATDFGAVDRVAMTDVDIAFASAPPLESVRAPVAGKLVDAPNPPLEVLQLVFAEAGLSLPPRHSSSYAPANGALVAFETVRGNFNGGLYVVDANHVRPLGKAWAQWARWLLDRIALLGKWRVHVDQVAFCLALAESGWNSEVFGNAWNHPTHMELPEVDEEPFLLHHHGRLDTHMRLETVAAPKAHAAIQRVNAAIDAFQRRHFDNRTFWNHRYAHHPSLGSGLGSRGEVLELKRSLLSKLIPADASVLDWGCGDLEVTRHLACADYLGVDLSAEALRIAGEKRPDWRFILPGGPEAAAVADGQYDVVLCLDVLIHQPDRDAYSALVSRLAAAARRGLLIAGFDANPDLRSHITYFHEPLGQTLARIPGIQSVLRLAEYRDTALYLASAASASSAAADKDALGLAAELLAGRCARIG